MKVRPHHQIALHTQLGIFESTHAYCLRFGNQHCLVSDQIPMVVERLNSPSYLLKRVEGVGQSNIRALLLEYTILSRFNCPVALWHDFWTIHAFLLERAIPQVFAGLSESATWRDLFLQLAIDYHPECATSCLPLRTQSSLQCRQPDSLESRYMGDDILDCVGFVGSVQEGDDLYVWTESFLRAYDIISMQLRWELECEQAVKQVRPSPKGLLVLFDTTIVLFNQQGERVVEQAIPSRTFQGLIPTHRGEGCLLLPRMFSGETIHWIRSLADGQKTEIPFTHLQEIGDDRWVVWHEDVEYFVLLDADCQPQQVFQGHENTIEQVRQYGEHLLSCSADATICLWNLDGSIGARYVDESDDTISDLYVIDEQRVLFWKGGWGCRDTNLYLWTVSTNTVEVLFQHVGTIAGATQAGEYIWVWDDSGVALILSCRNQEVRTIKLNEGKIQCLSIEDRVLTFSQYTNHGSRSTLPSEDYSIRLWTSNGECIAQFAGHQYFLSACYPRIDGFVSIAGGSDETIRTWSVSEKTAPHSKESPSQYLRYSKTEILGWRDGTIELYDGTGNLRCAAHFSVNLQMVWVWDEQIYCVDDQHGIFRLDAQLQTTVQYQHDQPLRLFEVSLADPTSPVVFAQDATNDLLLFTTWPPKRYPLQEAFFALSMVGEQCFVRGFDGYQLANPDGQLTAISPDCNRAVSRVLPWTEDRMLVVSEHVDVLSRQSNTLVKRLLTTESTFSNVTTNRTHVVGWTQDGDVYCWHCETMSLVWSHRTTGAHYSQKPFFGHFVGGNSDLLCASMNDQFFHFQQHTYTTFSMETMGLSDLDVWLSFWRQHNPHLCSNEVVVYPVSRGFFLLDLETLRVYTWFAVEQVRVVAVCERVPIIARNNTITPVIVLPDSGH